MSANPDVLENFDFEKFLQQDETAEMGDLSVAGVRRHARNMSTPEMGESQIAGARRHARKMPIPIPRPDGNVAFADFALETQRQIVGHVSTRHARARAFLTESADGSKGSPRLSTAVSTLFLSR